MNTFVFTWNPELWTWGPSVKDPQQKALKDAIQEIQETGLTTEKWMCRHHVKVRPGDIALLAITGNTRGFFGSGVVCNAGVIKEEDERIGSTKDVNKVWIQLDYLLDPKEDSILTSNFLNKELPEYKTPRGSGESLDYETGIKLRKIWSDFINKNTLKITSVEKITGSQEVFFEGAPTQIIQTKYERDPKARAKCIEHYGSTCIVCDFNFEKKYGQIGKDYIHVHHLTQIAMIGEAHEVDPIEGLRPVCPNCHSMIHKRREAYTIEAVKEFIENSGSA